MQVQNRIFRKVSLERLSSPEQLDMMMQVISPKGWIALMSLGGLVLVAILWGIYGSIPTKVSGKCILIQSGGLAGVTTQSGGRITEILVKVGDLVKKGDPIARLAQPELMDRLKTAQARLHELDTHQQQLRSYSAEGGYLESAYQEQERKNLESELQILKNKTRVMAERVETQQKLLQQGLITKHAFLSSRIDLSSAELELGNVKSRLKGASIRKLEGKKQKQNELNVIENQISEAQRGVDTLLLDISFSTRITTPYAGRIVEIKTDEGMLVAPGGAIVTIEPLESSGNGIEAVVYLAATDGKKVKVGMEAQIIPSTVKREEYGFIKGVVASVADYPASPEGMMKVLENQQLATDLAGGVLPIEMRAKLITEDNLSGFKWSSSVGPPIKVAAGTICKADVTVKRQRPITLAIPFLKKKMGLD